MAITETAETVKAPPQARAKQPRHPGGRPSSYSETIAARICDRLINGEPMARICADPDMPCYATVFNWENAHPEFLERSTRARIQGTHFLADDCIRISDDNTLEPNDKRVRVDTRLRLIGKWNRTIYGERTELTGAGGGAIQIEAKTLVIDAMSLGPDARALLKTALLEARAKREELAAPVPVDQSGD